jgi:predicted metal-dependent HD superfamily phosphohydrolase
MEKILRRHTNYLELSQWQDLMKSLGLAENHAVHGQLISAYCESQRHYHNLRHLEACFFHFEQVKGWLIAPAEVLLALWFHDAVYQPHSTKNELHSALWLRDVLENGDRPPAQIERICGHVLATQNHCAGEDLDRQFLLDIDLAILGSATDAFFQFDAKIRREYLWVPAETYHQQRLAVLTTFLERPHIYQTPYFRDKYESQARQNLTQAIALHRQLTAKQH